MSRWRSWLLLGIVVAALIGSALVVLGIGAVRVPVSDVARVVAVSYTHLTLPTIYSV